MGLMAFFLGMDPEEVDAHALAATRQTIGGVFDVLDSVCSLASASFCLSSAAVPSSAVSVPYQSAFQDESMTFTEAIISEVEERSFEGEGVSSDVEAMFCEVESRTQGNELTQIVSDEVVPASVIVLDELTSTLQAVYEKMVVLLSEQGSGSSSGVSASHFEASNNFKKVEESREQFQSDNLTSTLQAVYKKMVLILIEQSSCSSTGVNASHFEAFKLSKKEEEGREHLQDLCEAGVFVQSSRSCGIEDLDMHCLSHILSFLNNSSLQACSLVSRQWLEASNFARSDMELQGSTDLPILRRLLTRFNHLSALHIVDTDYALPPLERTGPLTYSCCDGAMEIIAQFGTNLQKLQLIGSDLFTDAGLAVILGACQELRSLTVKHCESFSGEGFSGYRSSRLERLEFDSCMEVTNDGLAQVAKACPGLRHLSIMRHSWGESLAEGVNKVALSCPLLESVALHACDIRNGTLFLFASRCAQLSEMSISSEPGVTDAGIDSLRRHLPRLNSLTLKHLPSVRKVPRSGSFVPLKALHLETWSVDDLAFRHLCEEKGLEELLFTKCNYVSDITVEAIFSRCCKLKCLTISDNERVTAEILKAYARSGSTANLEIRKCKNITPEMVPEGVTSSGKITVIY